jgi:glycosyltransferase involved in cell wall biosynthesis
VLREKGFKGPADVVPNAVDAELFRPLDRRDCRAKLQVDGFVVGYVGRLVPEKGIDDLLDALGECSESVQLLLVGESPDPERWKQRIAALKLESRVRLIGGRPASELPAIINALDVLVLPSRTTASWKEQFGRVVIEAHACGIPVIGSDSGAIPSVVGAAGIIFPERNPHELANAIKSLAGDADHCAELGLIGRKQVEELYTWDRVAERMHEIYLRCVRDSQSSHQVASAEVVRA